jgi:UDP-N-acetyl-D-galactosamine dehydrogenase
VLILGITFKENCADIRNTRVVDVFNELRDFGIRVDIYDPWASAEEVFDEYGISLVNEPTGKYEGILLAVSHEEFQKINIGDFKEDTSVIFDLKSVLPREGVDSRL